MGFRLQSFQKSLTGGEDFFLFSFARSQISPAEKDLAIIYANIHENSFEAFN